MTQPSALSERRPPRRLAQQCVGLRRMGLGLAAALAGTLALAQPVPCDHLASAASEAEPLLAHLQRCQNNAAYLARLGTLFNAEQRYLEAAEHLERALMLEPEATAPQMAYAIALAGSGDTLSALQLIGALLARTDLPEPQRAGLLAARTRWAEGAATGLRQTRLHAGLRLGHDTNLLGAPNLTSLTLTFPGEVVSLPLDGSNLPRPGAYLRTDARLEHTEIAADGTRWDAHLGLLQRASHRVPEAGSRQAELLLERSRPSRLQDGQPESPGHFASASAALLHTRGGTRYRSLGATAGWQWQAPALPGQASACQWRMGAEGQYRSLDSNTLLSGRYAGLLAQWSCSGLATAPQWRLVLRAGRDAPTHAARPGGAQAEYALRGFYSAPLGSQQAWLAEAELSHTRDATGYSPLLDNGARRRLHRMALRTEYQHTLAPGLTLLAGAELVAQQANLPLFSLRSRGVYVGVRGTW